MTVQKILVTCEECGIAYPAQHSGEEIHVIGTTACKCGSESFTEFTMDEKTGV